MSSPALIIPVLAVLLALSAFFSGSETALFSLSRARVRRYRDMGTRVGSRIAELLRLPRRLLITLLLGNLLVNTATTSILADFFTRQFGVKAVGISILVVTPLLLFFGEITPKTVAILRPVGMARVVALPLWLFVVVLTPLRVLVRLTTNALLLVLRQGRVESDPLLTRDEFKASLRTGRSGGSLGADEAEILHSITAFRTTVAREIMVPRSEMIGVTETASLAEAVRIARISRHARLPVYRGSMDRVTGMLVVAHLPAWLDLATFDTTVAQVMAMSLRPEALNLPPLVVEPYIVPELRNIDSMLAEMHQQNRQVAILLDEYGGTAGMVSRDNVIDALLGGAIGCRSRGAMIRMQPNGAVIVSGNTRIERINWDCNFSLPDDLDDTVAGYVMRLLGSVPRMGQRVRDERYEFSVLQMTRNRADFIRIQPLTG